MYPLAPKEPTANVRSAPSIESLDRAGGPDACHGPPARDVGQDDRVGADDHVVANSDRAENLGAGADSDPVTEHRLSVVGGSAVSECDSLMEHEVGSCNDLMTHDNSDAVDDREPGSDGCRRMDLGPGATDRSRLEPQSDNAARTVPPGPLREPELDDGAKSRL